MDDEIVVLPKRKEVGESATPEGASFEGRNACGWLLSGDSADDPLRALP